ncbi:MAG: HNH endonuclease signature motif containing protein, partial [Pseudomonadota bacterium]
RKSRSIPPAIRRALRLRDRGCRFPGCTHSRFVDGHHVKHWADGGETSLDNLVLLCRHHHRLVHEGSYGCRRTADGRFVFTTPDSSALPESWPLPGIAADEDPWQSLQRSMADLEIGPDICSPAWHAGDRMDWQMAVSALFEMSSPPR